MNNEKKIRKMFKPFIKQTIAIIVVLILIATLTGIYDMVGPAYVFRREVHGHMENAYYADYPELMNDELKSAIEGMNGLNLEEYMYGAFWPWDKTPDRHMTYQFKHLGGIVERIDAVIVWRNANYGENATGGTEALGDVYEAKMDNLRGFLKEEGWSDWIAQDTYYVNHHLWLYLFWIWYPLLWAIAGIYPIYFYIRGASSYHWEKIWDDKKQKWVWRRAYDS